MTDHSRDLVDPSSAVPDALVDAVKKEMQKNQRVQPGEVDEGARAVFPSWAQEAKSLITEL